MTDATVFLRLSSLGLVLLVATACDVGYNFGPYADTHATAMSVTLTWWTVNPVHKSNVYLSTAISTACNSGYFGLCRMMMTVSHALAQHFIKYEFYHPGAQFHPESQSVLFSMWDNPKHVGLQNNSEFPFQSLPAGGNVRPTPCPYSRPHTTLPLKY